MDTIQSGRVRLADLEFDQLTEAQTVQHIIAASRGKQGGWVVNPNVDICRQTRADPALRSLIETASLVIPDGMPLIWAARLRGDPRLERVAGGSLIFSLSQAAAQHRRSIYLLGGATEVPCRAAVRLRRRYPGLVVVGVDAPPFGFDADQAMVETVRSRLAAAAPDIVYVGLGCPKQERLIAALAPHFPEAWFISCGAAISYAAGTLRRAPRWMQQMGLAWLFRLLNEPRRLYRRYLIKDIPFAIKLLAAATAERFGAGK
jgi:exopolysaccharide biosynthesis WecB/TagA/CpsF family protein